MSVRSLMFTHRIVFRSEVGSYVWGMNRPDSDHDVFEIFQAPTTDLLKGTINSSRSYEYTITAQDNTEEQYQSHEIGNVVMQLLKNNWNYLLGVLSPNIIQPWHELETLQMLTKTNLSKLSYNSIHGLAVSNYRKYIQSNKDYTEARCNKIGRVLQAGIKLLRTGELDLRPITAVSRENIEMMIEELDKARDSSPLPDIPRHENAMLEWLLKIRIDDLHNGNSKAYTQ